MRYFKKFGDFCSGFSCFTVIIYLFRQFMVFKPEDSLEEKLGLRDKLWLFFSREDELAHFLLLILSLMLLISLLCSFIFERLPYLALIFSIPPMLFVLDLSLKDQIEDYPMLILLLTVLAPLSQLCECLRRDREDCGCRIGMAGDIICTGTAAFALYLRSRVNFLLSGADTSAVELNHFDAEIFRRIDTANLSLLLLIAIAYLALALIRLLLRDIYFIDLALSLIPLGVLIYHLNVNALEFHGEILVAFAAAVTVARALATFSGKAKIKHIKKRS